MSEQSSPAKAAPGSGDALAPTPPPFPASGSYADGLYLAVRHAISSGELPAGARMRETELATRYGVSRTPVREALRKLEADGLVVELPGRGLTVSNPTLNEILDAYLIREVLEGLAARLAAERALDTDLLRLEATMKQIQAAFDSGDSESTIRLSNAFDDVIFLAANSDRLYRMIHAARASQGQTMRGNIRYPGRLEQSIKERWLIWEALRTRQPRLAESATQEHLRQAREIRITVALEAKAEG
ncbi:GntR family transcriptional regulator [Caulobacter sp. S45]|uniref:GntR family transcriptional regulator n=1 Tax=Caulobacter sp. S45 TaxID=1641861 RepID=UPI00131CF217|nr:GntR family transcriptional regulator [Caulobacter sp. S45]